MDGCSINLGLVHVSYSVFGIGFDGVEDVGSSAVCVELTIHWHIHISDRAVDPKYLLQMFFSHVLSELLDNNLRASHCW